MAGGLLHKARQPRLSGMPLPVGDRLHTFGPCAFGPCGFGPISRFCRLRVQRVTQRPCSTHAKKHTACLAPAWHACSAFSLVTFESCLPALHALLQVIKKQIAEGVSRRRVGFTSSGAPARQHTEIKSADGSKVRARGVAEGKWDLSICCPAEACQSAVLYLTLCVMIGTWCLKEVAEAKQPAEGCLVRLAMRCKTAGSAGQSPWLMEGMHKTVGLVCALLADNRRGHKRCFQPLLKEEYRHGVSTR